MKNYLLGIGMLITMSVFAQSSHTIDFEPAGIGAGWNWVVDQNASNPAVEFVANPSVSGINTSATTAKFTALQAGMNWALTYTDDDGEFTFEATNSTVTIMVYKPVISVVAMKFEGMSGAIELQQTNTLVNQWEQLTFDFSGQIGNTYSRIVVIPDFVMPYVTGNDRTQDNVIYFDNIVLPDGVVSGPLPEPTTVPPTPTHAAEDVISIYTEIYTNLPGTDFNPFWGQSTIVTIDYNVAGNNTLRYEGLNYQGTQYTNQDVTAYEYLHVDFWTPNSTTLDFYLISPGAETAYALPITTGTWVSVDIPLTAYVPPVNLGNVFQFKVVGNGTVYFDNWYFWKNPTATGTVATLSDLQVDGSTIAGFLPSVVNYAYGLLEGTVTIPQITSATPTDPNASSVVINQATSIPGDATVVVTAEDGITTKTYTVSYAITIPNSAPATPGQNPADVISIYSDAYTSITGINYNPNWGQSTIVTVDEMVAGNNTLKYMNLNYQGTDWNGNPQDVSGYDYLHVDFWTGNATDLGIYIVSGVWPTNVEFEYVFTLNNQSWVSVDIPLSHFSNGGVNLADARQFKIEGNGNVWFDNLYFWKVSIPAASTWTGAVDNDWHTAGNWSDGVPGATTDVTIPSGLTNYPTIGAAASCNNIILASDAAGTATLVDNGFLTVNGIATVIRYYATGGTTNAEWHLIGAPVSDATAGVYTGNYMQWYQESTNSWFDIVSASDPLTSLQGFALYTPVDAMTYEYTGTLGDGTYNLPISAAGPITEHWNLFANPYPSSLDWDAVAAANIANLQSAAVYYLNQATGAYVSYNGGIGSGSQYVPPAQGFFVSGANDGAMFTVNNGMRSHMGGSNYYKASFDNLLVLEASGNGYTDATYLRFDVEATSSIDKQFDAFKIMGVSNPELPQIYTKSLEHNLSINVMPQTDAVVAGFVAGTNGMYTVGVNNAYGFEYIFLEDIVTGQVTDLQEGDYTFTYSTSDPEERFILHFNMVSVATYTPQAAHIYSTGNEVLVKLDENTSGEYSIYNTTGQLIATGELQPLNNVITVNKAGIYILKVRVEEAVISEKFVVK